MNSSAPTTNLDGLVHQLHEPGLVNDGHWFVGRLFRVDAATGLRIFQIYDGRVLDTHEISDGEGRRYAPVRLFSSAQKAMEFARRSPRVVIR